MKESSPAGRSSQERKKNRPAVWRAISFIKEKKWIGLLDLKELNENWSSTDHTIFSFFLTISTFVPATAVIVKKGKVLVIRRWPSGQHFSSPRSDLHRHNFLFALKEKNCAKKEMSCGRLNASWRLRLSSLGREVVKVGKEVCSRPRLIKPQRLLTANDFLFYYRRLVITSGLSWDLLFQFVNQHRPPATV